MALLTRQEIEILIQLHGEERVRRALQQLERQSNQTETRIQGLNGRLGQMGDTLGNLPGPLGQVGGAISGLSSRIGGLAGAGGLALIPIAAAAAGAGLVALSEKVNANAVALSLNAEKANMTIQRFQAMEIVAKSTGGEVETYRDVLNTLAERITEVGEGSEGMATAIARLGVNFEELKKQSPEEQLRTLVKAYDDLGRSQSASASMSEIFGDEFRNQLPLIRAGEQAIADTEAMLIKYGAAVDEEMIRKGKESAAVTKEVGIAWDGLMNQLSKETGDPWVEIKRGAASTLSFMREIVAEWQKLNKEVNVAAKNAGGFAGAKGAMPRADGTYATASGGVTRRVEATPTINFRRTTLANGKTMAQGAQERQVSIELARVEANKKAGEAAKKAESDKARAASAAASAAKSEASSKDRIAELGRQAIIDGERQLMTAQKASQEELARFETTKGRLSEIGKAEKDAVIEAARKRDVAIETAATETKNTNELKEQLRTLEQISTQAAGRLAAARESAIARASFERRSTGLGAIDRDTLSNLDSITADTARNRAEIEKGLASATQPEAIAKYREDLKKLNADEIATSEVIKGEAEKRKAYQQDWTNGVRNAYANFMDESNNLAGQMENVGKKLFDGLSSSLETFVMTGKLSVKDFARSVIADLASIAAKQAAVGIFGSIFGGATAGFADLAGWAGPGVFAKGGAFNAGTQFFANGGVVNRATGFGMAGGKMGVMGEAGPEAIVPLKRGRDGSLGVSMQGGNSGGVTIVNHVSVEQTGDAASAREQGQMLAAAIEVKVMEAMQKANRPGGMNNSASLRV